MRRLMVLLGIAIVVCAAAWVMKPGPEQIEAQLDSALRARVNNQDIAQQSDALSTAALIGCKLRPDDCVALLRRGIELTIEDRTLYTRIGVSGFDQTATCYGAFGRFWCTGQGGLTVADG